MQHEQRRLLGRQFGFYLKVIEEDVVDRSLLIRAWVSHWSRVEDSMEIEETGVAKGRQKVRLQDKRNR